MSNRLRIAHLAMSALPRSIGGLEVVVDQLIRAQISAGHDVTLVTRWKHSGAVNNAEFPYQALALPPQKSISKVPFQRVGAKWPVAASVRWHQLRQNFDLWHIHWLYPSAWMAFDALKSMGIPVLATAHGADINTDAENGYGYRLFKTHDDRLRTLAPMLTAVSAITPSIRHTLRDLGVREDVIVDIPNGVDAKRLARQTDTSVRERLNIGAETKIILSVGRNDPNKGFHHAAEILSELVAQGLDIVWIFVGRNTENLRPLFKDANLEDRVRLCPPITSQRGTDSAPPAQLAELYAAADVLVSTSAGEGFGLVLLEAMACRTPIVAFDVTGVRDVVEHKVDGLLTPYGDLPHMSSAIAAMLTDGELSSSLGEAGASKAEKYDWSEIASQYLDVYRKMLSRDGQ